MDATVSHHQTSSLQSVDQKGEDGPGWIRGLESQRCGRLQRDGVRQREREKGIERERIREPDVLRAILLWHSCLYMCSYYLFILVCVCVCVYECVCVVTGCWVGRCSY